jgi:tetratricopeptide (TPR) repeat protein
MALAMAWRWREAEPEFQRALELNPNNATAHYFYAFTFLAPQKRFEQALEEIHTALSLDPLSPIVNTNLAALLTLMHRYPESLAQFQKTLERDPEFSPAHLKLSSLYAVTGRFGEAESELQKFRLTTGTFTADAKGYLALSLGALSSDEWRAAIAQAYAMNGDRDKAFEYLEKAYANEDVELILGVRSPTLDPIRSDPRFRDLMRRLGLPE